MKATLGTVLGYVAWTIVWLVGNALLRTTGVLPSETSAPIQSGTALCALLGLSLICSLLAGYSAQTVWRINSAWPTLALVALLLATGIAVQWSVFHLMPLWYHVSFLVLLAPATLAGTRLAPRRAVVGT